MLLNKKSLVSSVLTPLFTTGLVCVNLWFLILKTGSVHSGPFEITILYSNTTGGNLFPCHCPSEPKGGLTKRATLIKQHREKEQILLLDSGDLFGVMPDEKRDSLLMCTYRAMRYDAVSIGDQEFSNGTAFFQRMMQKSKIPFLSANIFQKGLLLSKPYIIKKINEVKIGVIGITSPRAFFFTPKPQIEGITVEPWEEVVPKILKEIRPKVDLLILLSHLGYEEEQKIPEKFPEIDLIVGGHTQNLIETPEKIGQTLLVEAGAGGKYLGELKLKLENGKIIDYKGKLLPLVSEIPDDSLVNQILAEATVKPGRGLTQEVGGQKIPLVIFYARDCAECDSLKKFIAQKIVKKYRQEISVNWLDLDNPVNYQNLMEIEAKLEKRDNPIPIVVIEDEILGGNKLIFEKLPQILERKVQERRTTRRQPQKTSEKKNDDPPPPVEPLKMYLAYLLSPRCPHCQRAEYMLKAFVVQYPNLVVKKFDLNNSAEKKMAEALGMLYKIPPQKRLIAPTIFLGEDFLVSEEINDDSVRKLLEKYKDKGTKICWEEAEKLKSQAMEEIISRFKAWGILAIILAGLLDGLNPCSFTVLVFFISYLTFVGRKRGEILGVGISYTFADFLVYFLIGLGILSFLLSLKILPLITRILYTAMALLVFVLSFLNFRDYFKAKQGKFSEVTLQLSRGTKQRIHRLIRERMGTGGVITGAFVVGLITSVLEFACTGQVYLPTITLVSQLTTYRLTAAGYLLLYNLMFEVPMILVFLVAYFGISSKKIGEVMEKSVPGVKLATAFLFLLLGGFLIYVLLLG
ncbi:MAG: hypothetical protein AB1393_01820 [Candidatus Edwardsbacteria bacterium]